MPNKALVSVAAHVLEASGVDNRSFASNRRSEPRLVPGGIGPETEPSLTYMKGTLERADSWLDELVKALGMAGISKSQVSRLCAEIDERVRSFLERPIEGLPGRVWERCPNPAPTGQWPYLWIDATYVKVREAGRVVSVAVTIAVAVNTDGRREVLGMAIGASEAETFWVGQTQVARSSRYWTKVQLRPACGASHNSCRRERIRPPA